MATDCPTKCVAALVTICSLFLCCALSDATKLVDDAFVAFVRGPDNFARFCEEHSLTAHKPFLALFYGIHLGVLQYRRQKKKPVKHKHIKYLDILYEYFLNVYAGNEEVVRPIFKGIQIFDPPVPGADIIGLNEALKRVVQGNQIRLQNEKELEREDRRTAKLDRDNFGKIMERMEGKAKEVLSTIQSFNGFLLPNIQNWTTQDEQFVAFLREGMTAKNSVCSNEQMYKFESRLVMLHLLRKHWHCAIDEIRWAEKCAKMRRIIDTVYEYLFRESYGIAAVKPIIAIYRRPNSDHIELSRDSLEDLLFGFYEVMPRILVQRTPYVNFELLNENEMRYATDSKNDFPIEGTVFEVVNSIPSAGGNRMSDQNEQELLREVFDDQLIKLHGKWTKVAQQQMAFEANQKVVHENVLKRKQEQKAFETALMTFQKQLIARAGEQKAIKASLREVQKKMIGQQQQRGQRACEAELIAFSDKLIKRTGEGMAFDSELSAICDRWIERVGEQRAEADEYELNALHEQLIKRAKEQQKLTKTVRQLCESPFFNYC